MEPIYAATLLAGLVPEGFAPADQRITLVTTDSREVCPDSIFVAFPGQKFDGHDFAAKALEAGAAYVVLNHPVEGVPAEKTILCPDSYKAMLTLGANYRAQFSPKIIGITGSAGKTTTKEFCYAALAACGKALRTEGNQNNELGVPRTLLRLEQDTQYAAVEMGMNHAGDIERLSLCAKPDAAIITCIGMSHIGNLGSQENICKAKLEICAGLPEGAPLVLNYDDPFLRAAQLPAHVKPVWFSLTSQEADASASAIRQDKKGTSFLLDDPENGCFMVTIPAIGKHNVANALAAYCAATRLGLPAREVIQGLKNFKQVGMRQKLVDHKGVKVIEDCYNANPDSMRAALETFKTLPAKRRFALLADMLELGDAARAAHEEVGRQVAAAELDFLITYGELAHRIAVTAAAKGVRTVYAHSHQEAADILAKLVQPGDLVLVKGSRGMELEKALQIFYEEYEPEQA